MKTQDEIGSVISECMGHFEKEYMGQVPRTFALWPSAGKAGRAKKINLLDYPPPR